MNLGIVTLRALVLTVVMCGCAFASSIQYRVIDIGSLGGNSYASAINNLGQVVGGSYTSTGEHQAFVYSEGRIRSLGSPFESVNSYATGINDSGRIVGEYINNSVRGAFTYYNGVSTGIITNSGRYLSSATGINNAGQISGYSSLLNGMMGVTALLYTGGELTGTGPASSLAGAYSAAFGLNDNGDMVGFSYTDSGYEHAFLYADGKMIDVGTISSALGSTSYGYAINNLGQIVGTSGGNAFSYYDGSMIDLGLLPGGRYSTAYGVNDNGQIVGEAYVGFDRRAFLYSEDMMYDLNSLTINDGFNILTASGINQNGWIVGTALVNGQEHAVLLQPVPLPATIWLLGSGLAGLGCFQRFRRK